jgi:YfiH family protein
MHVSPASAASAAPSASSASSASPVSPLSLVAGNLRRAGFPHGFSTRLGGVSRGAFASLNFGAGDAPGNVAENVQRFATAATFDPRALRQVTQVHGTKAVNANLMNDGANAREEADALFLAPGGASHARAVGVRVADCVPVLVATEDRGEIAAIHAGWRGIAAGIVGAALGKLEGKKLVAAIGPCIGPCCFDVGAEVVPRLLAAASNDEAIVARREGEKAYLDLRRAVRRQLESAGVTDIEDVPGCTKCDPERFFSYRRDGAESGRHLAVIALRA